MRSKHRVALGVRFVQIHSYAWNAAKRATTLVELIILTVLVLNYSSSIPNLLGSSSADSSRGFLLAIAGTLSGLLGIVVAVLLIALEALRKVFSRYGISVIIGSRHFISLFTVYVAVIAASVISSAGIGRFDATVVNALCNVIVALFLICLIGLASECWAILVETRPDTRLDCLVNAIDANLVRSVGSSPFRGPEGPLLVLQQAIIRFIDENDSHSAQMAMAKLAKRYPLLLAAGANTGHLAAAFLPLLYSTVHEAFRCNDMRSLQTTVDCVKSMHFHMVRSHAQWMELDSLEKCLHSAIARLIENGRTDIERSGPRTICDLWMDHLRSGVSSWVPGPRDEGCDFNVEGNVVAHLQWTHISHGYARHLFSLLSIALSRRNEWAVENGSSSLADILSFVDRSTNLCIEAKTDIILNTLSSYHSFMNECLSQAPSMLQRISIHGPLSEYVIGHMLESQAPYAKTAFQRMGHFAIRAAQKSSINYMMINDIGIIGRTAAADACKLDFRDDVVQYAVITLSKIASTISQFQDENSIFLEQEVGRQIGSLWDNVNQADPNSPLLPLIAKVLSERFPNGIQKDPLILIDDWPCSVRIAGNVKSEGSAECLIEDASEDTSCS